MRKAQQIGYLAFYEIKKEQHSMYRPKQALKI
jgi:hypothetical protein